MTSGRTTAAQTAFPPRNAPGGLKVLLGVLVAVGIVAFIAGLLGGDRLRAWQIFFVNFLFWSGLAQGGVVMAAVYRITNARWGDHFRRIGEGMVAFLPVSFVLYLVLVIAGQEIFPWLREPVHGKEAWLSAPFLFGRDGAVFLVLMWLSGTYVYYSIRPDLGQAPSGTGGAPASGLVHRLMKHWRGWETESLESGRRLARLTPALLIAFAVLYSLIGFDLVMPLDPHWFSTLFGWLYFLHAFFAGLVMVMTLAILSRPWFGTAGAFTEGQWHDMGKFVFGFCLLSGGFFWSQYLVIWYGNLPEESSFLMKRFYTQPWEPLMWVYIILAYLFPLAVFLSRRVKEIPAALLVMGVLILGALFIERFIAVVPFLWQGATIPFGLVELVVTAGFAALFVLSWIFFAERVTLVPKPEKRAERGE
ncbi:MAG: hypothetical protein AB1428_15235 [Bacteroidota bacterium]